MAGRFPSAWLDELFAKADIVQVVSSYVHLKQDGHRFWGLCPFHNEKTPSFSVNPDLNLYYCFGCKAGGNTIQFIMDMENMDFFEAAKTLAERVNLPLPELREDPDYYIQKTKREKLFEINKLAAQFYHQHLWTVGGRPVLDYFYKRGLTDAVIRKFGLGASPDKWDALCTHLTDAGYKKEDLVEAGLLVKNEKSEFDMFRGRAMFPIINSQGQVLGFGGRVLDGTQPKYLNTADTPVFNKRLGVYAVNLLKKERNLKKVILVEGYMDVVSLVQFGVKGVVATLGTSLTQEQARLLKRFAPEVWVAYDGDAAGQHAILRALDIFEAEDISAKVLFFPNNMDPDEFIRKKGLDAFEALKPLTSVAYRLQTEKSKYDLTDEDGRIAYAKVGAELLKKISSPIDLDRFLSLLSKETGIEKEILSAQVGTPQSEDIKKNHFEKKFPKMQKKLNSGKELQKAERILLSLVASGRLPDDLVSEEDFSHEIESSIFKLLRQGMSPREILMQSDDENFKEACGEIFFEKNESFSDTELARQAGECLRIMRIDRMEKLLETQRMNYEVTEDETMKRNALAEIVALTKELTFLKQKR